MNGAMKVFSVLMVGVVTLAAAALLLGLQPYYAEQAVVAPYTTDGAVTVINKGGWPGMMRWGPGNYTFSVEEAVVSGRLTGLDYRYLVIETGEERIMVRTTTMWLLVNGERYSLLRLAFEDRLNAGDEVRLTVYRVTVTRPDGLQNSFYVLRQITDLTTGLQASAPQHGWRTVAPSPTATNM